MNTITITGVHEPCGHGEDLVTSADHSGYWPTRLVYHEVDHLFGVLYQTRMRAGVEPIPVSRYGGTHQQWIYP
jgi:hypothetical protein